WASFGSQKGEIRPIEAQIRQKLFIPSKLEPWPLFQGSLPRGSLETWGDKLDAIDFYVVIGQSRPVSLRSGSNLKAGVDDSANRDPGLVNFKIYKPTTNHGSVIEQEHTVTQDGFVRFAISGKL
ncbi:hypothetical protein KBY96_13310, partial [Cyanobium sp. ATX 6A2]|uniref:hypothetical protein n=1 Tax=Cyanobium sp. ATX 6A2 TaxID=2823700 RepID=UPI0020CC75CB